MRGRLGWHDAASRLRGPAVADVAAHFAARWQRGRPASSSPAPAAAAPGRRRRASRSCAPSPRRSTTSCPHGDFRILEAYTRALRSARELVYLESQFLWSPQIVEILADKLREPPSDDFRVVVLLPAKPNNGADTRAASSACSPTPTTAPAASWPRTISARTGGLTRAAVRARQDRDRRRRAG